MTANVEMPIFTVKDMIRELPFQKMGKRWIDQYPNDALLHELTDKQNALSSSAFFRCKKKLKVITKAYNQKKSARK